MREIISQQQIRDGVARLAADLQQEYGTKSLMVVGILTGSIVLLADLIRQLNMPLRIGLLQASSYRGPATTRSALKINSELLPDLRDRHVLVLDDIFDTGHTLVEVIAQINQYHPASIRSAVLLKKQDRCEVAIEPDFVVFEIPDEFVVGYGLDYNDMHRDLPYIAALEPGDLHE